MNEKPGTHVARIVYVSADDFTKGQDKIQDMYVKLNQDAIDKSMLIMNQVVSVCAVPGGFAYIVVCQWMNRHEVEAMNLRHNLMSGGDGRRTN